jgi:hypothetical protein
LGVGDIEMQSSDARAFLENAGLAAIVLVLMLALFGVPG